MKVLLIKNIKFNLVHSRIGDRFLLKLNDLCDLTIYGSNPKEIKDNVSAEEFGKFNLVEHRNEYTSEDMLRECGTPDVILLHQHNNAKALVPNDFGTVKIPKAILLFDTYVLPDVKSNCSPKAELLQKAKIDLVIRRGCRTFYDEDLFQIPSVWLPFSVREENHYTDPNTRFLYGRRNKVTFVGSGYESKNKDMYKTLKQAVDILEPESDLFVYQGRVGIDAYPNAIRSCVGALSYTFEHYKGHPAKLFELLGSGTGVLTTAFSNKKELFGEEDICWEFQPSCDNLVGIVRGMLNDRKELYRRTRNALNVINSKHLDRHRVVELYNILEALASGDQVPQLWE